VNTAVEISMLLQSVRRRVVLQTEWPNRILYETRNDGMSILHVARPKYQSLSDTAMPNTIAFISIVQRVLAVGKERGGHIEEMAILALRRSLRVS